MTNRDSLNEWRLICAKGLVPAEIVAFMKQVFQIVEIKARVGEVNGIKFEVRSREKNHSVPHVHAEYGEYTISIAILTGEVLSGNLPRTQQRFAINWVMSHSEELQGKWSQFTISATAAGTKSYLR